VVGDLGNFVCEQGFWVYVSNSSVCDLGPLVCELTNSVWLCVCVHRYISQLRSLAFAAFLPSWRPALIPHNGQAGRRTDRGHHEEGEAGHEQSGEWR
jgi:hypothetical protein